MHNFDPTIDKTPLPERVDPLAGRTGGDPDAARPYGLIGLILSLAAILLIALVYAAVMCVLTYGFLFGWSHLVEVSKQFSATLASGEDSILPIVVSDLGNSLVFPLTLSLILYLAVSLAVVTLARLRGGKAWRSLIGWRPWTPFKAGRAFWLICAAGLIYGLAANVAIAYFYPASKDWFKVPNEMPSALLLFVLAVVFAPIAEELLFRGWIYTSLRARLGLWTALLVSSALFAAAHYEDSHIYALAVFPIGLALGGLRDVTGSLKASISFHAFFNAVAFGLALLDLS